MLEWEYQTVFGRTCGYLFLTTNFGFYDYPDYNSQRNYKSESGGKQSKDRTSNSTYNQNELSNPCYYSSSIYYGAQEVYSPNSPSKTTTSHHAVSYQYHDSWVMTTNFGFNSNMHEPNLISLLCVIRLRKMEGLMIPMEVIPIALRVGIGGKVIKLLNLWY